MKLRKFDHSRTPSTVLSSSAAEQQVSLFATISGLTDMLIEKAVRWARGLDCRIRAGKWWSTRLDGKLMKVCSRPVKRAGRANKAPDTKGLIRRWRDVIPNESSIYTCLRRLKVLECLCLWWWRAWESKIEFYAAPMGAVTRQKEERSKALHEWDRRCRSEYLAQYWISRTCICSHRWSQLSGCIHSAVFQNFWRRRGKPP